MANTFENLINLEDYDNKPINLEDYDEKLWWTDYDEDIDYYDDATADYLFFSFLEEMDEEIEDYNDKPWWVDYDGDIEEERRKIIERVSKIEDPKERLKKYEELLNKLEYNEYYAYNRHLKSDSYLINLRLGLISYEDEDNKEFFCHILEDSNMVNCSRYSAENVLIMNKNKKFTFLNSIKEIYDYDYDKIIEKRLIKMRREYGDEWKEDDEKIYEIVLVRLY